MRIVLVAIAAVWSLLTPAGELRDRYDAWRQLADSPTPAPSTSNQILSVIVARLPGASAPDGPVIEVLYNYEEKLFVYRAVGDRDPGVARSGRALKPQKLQALANFLVDSGFFAQSVPSATATKLEAGTLVGVRTTSGEKWVFEAQSGAERQPLLWALSTLLLGMVPDGVKDAEPVPSVVEHFGALAVSDMARRFDEIWNKEGRVTVYCLGDEVTEPSCHTGGQYVYPDMVQTALRGFLQERNLFVLGAAIDLGTTADALTRLDELVLDKNPDVVTLMFGQHDAGKLSVEKFRENLVALVTRCRNAGVEPVLCTPVYTGTMSTIPEQNQYLDVVREVARETSVTLADCYAAWQGGRESDITIQRESRTGQTHPNLLGHRYLAQTITAALVGTEVQLPWYREPNPMLPQTLACLQEGRPVRLLAVPPYGELVQGLLERAVPGVSVELTSWELSSATMTQSLANPDVDYSAFDVVFLSPPADVSVENIEWLTTHIGPVVCSVLGAGSVDVVIVPPSLAAPERWKSEPVDSALRSQIEAHGVATVAPEPWKEGNPDKQVRHWLGLALYRAKILTSSEYRDWTR